MMIWMINIKILMNWSITSMTKDDCWMCRTRKTNASAPPGHDFRDQQPKSFSNTAESNKSAGLRKWSPLFWIRIINLFVSWRGAIGRKQLESARSYKQIPPRVRRHDCMNTCRPHGILATCPRKHMQAKAPISSMSALHLLVHHIRPLVWMWIVSFHAVARSLEGTSWLLIQLHN